MSEQRSLLDDDLAKRALAGFAKFQIALGVMIFLPAWSARYWQGWLYWLLFGAVCVLITLYFLRHDRALIERRMVESGSAKYPDPRSSPASSRPSTVPIPSRMGRAVRTKRCGNPAALLLSTSALSRPGPHHSFSVETPALTGPASNQALD